MLTAHYGAFRRAKTTPSRCQELSVGPVYFFGPFLGFFLFAQDKQTWNPLWTQWNLDAPKFVQYNRQKCPICAKCVKGVLGKHISTAHPVSRANFVCTVIGCEQTFFTKKMHERAIWQRTTESRSPSHLGVTNQGASLVHLKQTGTSWIT